MRYQTIGSLNVGHLTDEQSARTCLGYRYGALRGASSFTAFVTREEMIDWLCVRGLRRELGITKEGRRA